MSFRLSATARESRDYRWDGVVQLELTYDFFDLHPHMEMIDGVRSPNLWREIISQVSCMLG